MGWSYRVNPQSKKSLIEERVKTQSNSEGKTWTVIAHAVRGNNLWKVVEVKQASGESEGYIALDLLGTGGRNEGWGYKDMCEIEGPYYYSCPLGYLGMVPEANAEWREGVRA